MAKSAGTELGPSVADGDRFAVKDRSRCACRGPIFVGAINEAPISPTATLRQDPRLPEAWFNWLAATLDTLSSKETDRLPLNQEAVTCRLRAAFADRVNPTVDWWTTAHNDLHWNNLTQPGGFLLDWESWGIAPLGYDAATLYCHSLLVPDMAARVRATFADILNTPDGVRSQLLAIARMLRRASKGDYSDLVLPLHRLADTLTDR